LRPLDSGAAARNVAFVLGGQAVLAGSKFAALLLLSHRLSAVRFDECAIYAGSSLVVGNLCELGINLSCLKFAADRRGADWLRIVSRFLLLRLALTAGLIAAIFLLAPAASLRLLHHPEYTAALRLACGSAAVASLSAFSLALLQSRLKFRRMARLNALAAILQIAPVLLVLRGAPGLPSLFAGDLLSRSWILLANLALLAAVLRARRWPGPRPAWKPIALFANWITLSTLIGALYNYIPSIALARWGAASALGAYSLGMSLAGGLALLVSTTSTVLLPEAVAASTPQRRRAYLRAYLPGAALLSASLLAVTWLAGPLAARVFPRSLPAAVRVFQLLATAQMALLVANPVQFLLYGAGRPHWCTASDAALTLLFGALTVWLAPAYGAIGVAWALLIALAAVKLVTVAAVLRL
jgi:O-antigen/teichoic acid export membrane protein